MLEIKQKFCLRLRSSSLWCCRSCLVDGSSPPNTTLGLTLIYLVLYWSVCPHYAKCWHYTWSYTLILYYPEVCGHCSHYTKCWHAKCFNQFEAVTFHVLVGCVFVFWHVIFVWKIMLSTQIGFSQSARQRRPSFSFGLFWFLCLANLVFKS